MPRSHTVPRDQLLDALTTGTYAYLVTDVIWLTSAVLAAVVVKRINEWQELA